MDKSKQEYDRRQSCRVAIIKSLKGSEPSDGSKSEKNLKESKKIDESRVESQRKSIKELTLKKAKASSQSILKPNLISRKPKTQNEENFTSNVISSSEDVAIQNNQALETFEILNSSVFLLLDQQKSEISPNKNDPSSSTQMDIDLPVSDLHEEAAMAIDSEIIKAVRQPAMETHSVLLDHQFVGLEIPNDKIDDWSEADVKGIDASRNTTFSSTPSSSISEETMSQESLPSPIYSPIDTGLNQESQKASQTIQETFDRSLSEVESLIFGESSEESATSTSQHVEMEYRTIKMMSWCLDGIESFIHEGGETFVNKEMPDIVCLQNLKCEEESEILSSLYMPFNDFYYAFGKNSSALAVFTKKAPISEVKTSGVDILDEFATVMILEFEDFRLLNVCAPDTGLGLTKLKEKIDWFEAFNEYVGALQANPKRLIIAGNLKVALEEIDVGNSIHRGLLEGSTREEIEKMKGLLGMDLIDCFRYSNPDKKKAFTHYTNYPHLGRIPKCGQRVDYFLASMDLKNSIRTCFVSSELLQFHHCPITLTLNLYRYHQMP